MEQWLEGGGEVHRVSYLDWILEKRFKQRRGTHEGSSNDGNDNYGDHLESTKHFHIVLLI